MFKKFAFEQNHYEQQILLIYRERNQVEYQKFYLYTSRRFLLNWKFKRKPSNISSVLQRTVANSNYEISFSNRFSGMRQLS